MKTEKRTLTIEDVMFDFGRIEQWQAIRDGWIYFGTEDPGEQSWGIQLKKGRYQVSFNLGWYSQEGTAEDLQNLGRIMKGMVAAEKAFGLVMCPETGCEKQKSQWVGLVESIGTSSRSKVSVCVNIPYDDE